MPGHNHSMVSTDSDSLIPSTVPSSGIFSRPSRPFKPPSTTEVQIESIRPQPPTTIPTLREISDQLDYSGLTNSDRDSNYPEAIIERATRVNWISQLGLTEVKNVDDIELRLWDKYAFRIAERLPSDAIMIEIGMARNFHRVFSTLSALNTLEKNIRYYIFDSDPKKLRVGLNKIVSSVRKFRYVELKGIYGTYPDLLEWLRSSESIRSKPKVVVWMGSCFGSFDIQSMASFLRAITKHLSWGDQMLLGITPYTKADRVIDSIGGRLALENIPLTAAFKALEEEANEDLFAPGHWIHNRHLELATGFQESYISPRYDLYIDSVVVAGQADKFVINSTSKYTPTQLQHLWAIAGLLHETTWQDTASKVGINMLTKSKLRFPLQAAHYIKKIIPTLNDWTLLWTAWDMVSKQMISKEDFLFKPVDMQHPIIFYMGHASTFLDINLARDTEEPRTEPLDYAHIFKRESPKPPAGDPDVCRDDDELPKVWPEVDEIFQFQMAVRERVTKLYSSSNISKPQVRRALCMGFEHEAMQFETLLCMIVQHSQALPPKGVVRPDFSAQAEASTSNEVPIQWFNVPERTVTIGFDEPEKPGEVYGWDHEHPKRLVKVPAFKAAGRPITNGEYSEYLEKTDTKSIPASWVDDFFRDNSSDDLTGSSITSASPSFLHGKAVKTVFGPVPLKYALHWPVAASYNELEGCANWAGCRLPTREEVESIDEQAKPQGRKESRSPDTRSVAESIYTDLENSETGLRQWYPTPVTSSFRFCSRAQFGGLWEWTSSVLEAHEGFQPRSEYPGYTAGYFDTNHNIILGGSWATHSRLASRKTVINWHPRDYPYAFAGARMVKGSKDE